MSVPVQSWSRQVAAVGPDSSPLRFRPKSPLSPHRATLGLVASGESQLPQEMSLHSDLSCLHTLIWAVAFFAGKFGQSRPLGLEIPFILGKYQALCLALSTLIVSIGEV